MITSWVAELVSRYSFITKAELKGVYLELHYKYQDKERIKKVSVRANKDKLISIIESIKHDTNYYEEKKIRDEKVREALKKDKERPLIFVNN